MKEITAANTIAAEAHSFTMPEKKKHLKVEIMQSMKLRLQKTQICKVVLLIPTAFASHTRS